MRHFRFSAAFAVLWLAAALPASAALTHCDTGTNYAANTEFVACCPLVSVSCGDCCSIDKAHASSCPQTKPHKVACDADAREATTVPAVAMSNCPGVTIPPDATSFVACCQFSRVQVSGVCNDCCKVDAAQVAKCPTMKPHKADCDAAATLGARGTGTASAPKVIDVPNALGTPYLQVVIGNFARILVGISGSIALLIFVWAGITMMRANGDPKLIQKAKDMLVWTAVGLLIIFGSEAIVRSVLSALFSGSAT